MTTVWPLAAFGNRSPLARAAATASMADQYPHNPRLLRQLLGALPADACARDVYAASVAAADPSRPAHRVYLEDLAEALALPMPLVRQLDREAGGLQRAEAV
ncbi:MAG: DUF533 domain-containing protein [Pseudomonadales bacterium]